MLYGTPSPPARPTNIKVLVVEDSAADAELNILELVRAGFAPDWVQVANEDDFRAAIRNSPDLILSDYSMPRFDGLRALVILQESGLSIPFILISGTIGEEIAVAAMRQGAADYLLKDRLARLGPAVRSALAQAKLRRDQGITQIALTESEARFRQIAEHLDEIICLTDAVGGKALYINPRYEEIWGRSCASFYEDPGSWLQAVHAEDRQRVALASQIMKTEATFTEIYRVVRPDGSIRWVRDRRQPIWDESGALVRVVGAATDVTDQKKAEDQLLRAQRLEAIGTLSLGIAHDLNNILAPTLMVTTMLRETLDNGRDAELLDVIEQGARRGANILQQLLTFTRGASHRPAIIPSRDLCHAMLTVMRETFPRDIEIIDESSEELAPMYADATQIHQVLMNLCVNARDAMPRGGKLTLAARNCQVSPDEAAANAPAGAGPHVQFAVGDTGCGISPEIIPRIFEPFYTTKPVGEGTGLGLSTVAGIVRSHGGFITVESELGRGSRFSVYLPATPGVDRETEPPANPAIGSGGGESVLLVDDERSIRFVSQRTLEKAGYRVATAADGEQALKRIESRTPVFDVIITDLMMPNLSGLTLIKTLRKSGDQVKIIATTGLDTRFSQEELARVGVTEILPKPFSSADLLNAVRRQLAK